MSDSLLSRIWRNTKQILPYTSLSHLGRNKVKFGSRGTGEGRVATLGLVESFGGIGGARRALEILGVTPGLHLHLETDEKAKRVIDKQDISGGGRNGL